MTNRKQRRMLQQADRTVAAFRKAGMTLVPAEGWARTMRKALNMNLAQLAMRLDKTPIAVNKLERRERTGQITLKSLCEIAEAMDMKLVYALVPKEGSLEGIVWKAASSKATEIMEGANTTTRLNDQPNSPEQLELSKTDMAHELALQMPKFLWD